MVEPTDSSPRTGSAGDQLPVMGAPNAALGARLAMDPYHMSQYVRKRLSWYLI